MICNQTMFFNEIIKNRIPNPICVLLLCYKLRCMCKLIKTMEQKRGNTFFSTRHNNLHQQAQLVNHFIHHLRCIRLECEQTTHKHRFHNALFKSLAFRACIQYILRWITYFSLFFVVVHYLSTGVFCIRDLQRI